LLEIKKVLPDSIADDLSFLPGDIITTINGKEINDQIDFRFYQAEENIELYINRGDETLVYEIEKEFDEDLGIELDEMKMNACGNNCVFCFVYQNPKGMRKQLYFKDEDFRFSFLYGHYVTLTKTTRSELERIVEQNLSPLYISVHSTEEKTRKFLLGIKENDHLIDKIKYLTQNGIELHVQIVLCPEINDGHIFDQTVNDLIKFYPRVRSIAMVPLGLTQHRKNLPQLRLNTQDELINMIGYVDKLRSEIFEKIGDHFVYLADEFFIKADQDLQSADYYGDFYQIENGVGEFRAMIDLFNLNRAKLPESISKPIKITWITGTLAEKYLKKFIIDKLNSINNIHIELVAIKNDFYGRSISVSGLIVAEDIFKQLSNRNIGDVLFLPPNILNKDGLFLDDWNIEKLQDKLNIMCHIYTEPIHEIVQVLKKRKILT